MRELCPGSGQAGELLGGYQARCRGCGFVYSTAMDEPLTAPHLPPDAEGMVAFVPSGLISVSCPPGAEELARRLVATTFRCEDCGRRYGEHRVEGDRVECPEARE